MLDELETHLRIRGPVHRQLPGDLEHVLAEQGHPGGAVRLLKVAAGGQRRTAVEDADVVKTQESALEHIAAETVLAVHPPGEVEQELLEGALEPIEVALALADLLQSVRKQSSPRMHRRIDITEIPLIGWELPVGMKIVLPDHQVQLLLAEVLIHQGERQHMKRQVPCRIPGVLPLVRHGHDVRIVHVVPALVAGGASFRVERVSPVLLEPLVHIVVIELLGPEHACNRLAHHVGLIGAQRRRDDRSVELIRLLPASLH